MTPIRTVLLVLAQRLLHQRRHQDASRIDTAALNAPLARKSPKHRDAEDDVPSPPLTRLEAFALTHPIRVRKACCQLLGVLPSQIQLSGKRQQVPPDGAVAPQRPSAIAKLLQLARYARNKPIQRQTGRNLRVGLIHDRPLPTKGDLMAAGRPIMKVLCAAIRS